MDDGRPPTIEELNAQAVLATEGWAVDPLASIAKVLEAGGATAETQRAIAKLFRGPTRLGISIKMDGHRDIRNLKRGLERRRLWLKHGRYIMSFVPQMGSDERAIDAARIELFPKDRDSKKTYYLRDALAYARAMDDFLPRWEVECAKTGLVYPATNVGRMQQTRDGEECFHAADYRKESARERSKPKRPRAKAKP